MSALEITPRETSDLLRADPASVLLIDCRTDEERAIATIAAALHVPMNQTIDRLPDIEASDARHIIVHCHHGMRSLQVVSLLRRAGIETARSMAGGIERWSIEVDPKVPRY